VRFSLRHEMRRLISALSRSGDCCGLLLESVKNNYKSGKNSLVLDSSLAFPILSLQHGIHGRGLATKLDWADIGAKLAEELSFHGGSEELFLAIDGKYQKKDNRFQELEQELEKKIL
jgi:hypothetical protein